jgi:hypothetical protein
MLDDMVQPWVRFAFMNLVARWAALLTFAGCASSPPPAQGARDADQLKTLITQRDQANARWTAAAAPHRTTCELKAGDCRMTVNEKRELFLRDQSSADCRQPDLELEAQCTVKQLKGTLVPPLALDYLQADLWCFEKLLGCITELETQDKDASLDQRAALRRNEIETSAPGVAARARVSLAQAKIAYLRSTLPPAAETDCTDKQAPPSCLEPAQKKLAALDEEYRRSEKNYVRDRVMTRYEQATAEEAACFAEEFECLNAAVNKYGETTETRRWLEKNLVILKQRQELLEKIGSAIATPCIDQGIAKHQTQIVQSYVAFVREPVLFFRMQLHRTIFAMHQTQIACIKDLAADEPSD